MFVSVVAINIHHGSHSRHIEEASGIAQLGLAQKAGIAPFLAGLPSPQPTKRRHILRYVGFQKEGALFCRAHNKEYCILRPILGHPVCGNSHINPELRRGVGICLCPVLHRNWFRIRRITPQYLYPFVWDPKNHLDIR